MPVPVDVSRGRLQPRSAKRSRRRSAPRTRDRAAGPPLRADGRHAPARARRRAHGLARRRGRLPGARRGARRATRRARAGSPAAFSFYPGKNLGAFGDAGALSRTTRELAERACAALREHGQREKYRHEVEGYTARLDTIQALVLLRKLPLLDGWNDERRAVAARTTPRRSPASAISYFLPVPTGSEPVWHLYVVRTADPDGARRRISAARHRHGPPLPRAAPPGGGLRVARLRARARSRWPRRSAASASRCRSSRA